MYIENYLSHNWLIKRAINNKVYGHLHNLHGVVVDLGCGTRPYEADILPLVDSYVGIDWPKSLHDFSGDIVADLNRPLPLGNETANYIISFEVLEHVAEPGLMLAEAYRILRSDGQLLLSVPFQWWVHEEPWDYQRFTRYGLEYQLRKVGFNSISIQPTSGFWSMWILKLNYQLVRLIRGPHLIRILIRLVLIPIWWWNQVLSSLADRYWHEDKETVGYFVTAYKGTITEK